MAMLLMTVARPSRTVAGETTAAPIRDGLIKVHTWCLEQPMAYCQYRDDAGRSATIDGQRQDLVSVQ